MSRLSTAQTSSLFESLRRDVYLWALRLLGSHNDALDLVQDVFMRWLVQNRRCKPRNPRTWLRRTTTNRAIDVIRSRRRLAGFMDLEGAREIGADTRENQEPERAELRADVAEALKELTGAQRTVLVAKEYDGLRFAAIARELGVSVSTVKTHYLRAIQRLRHLLAGRWGSERREDR